MRDVDIPVSPDVGRLLYVLSRPGAKSLSEFGTSFCLSRHPSGRRLRELRRRPCRRHRARPAQAERAAAELPSRGALRALDLRVGDAFGAAQIRRGLQRRSASARLLKEAYLPCSVCLEPQLSPGALVVADDLAIAPERACPPTLEYVRQPARSVSVELPLGDRTEVSLRT